jgi:uncharacterized membrane protein
MVVLPVFITLWLVTWVFSLLNAHVISPLGELLLWKVLRLRPDTELTFWFTQVIAPGLAVLIGVICLYVLGLLAGSWLQRAIDAVFLRLPFISAVHKSVRQVFKTFESKGGQELPRRVVLVPFPHPGMKAPAFVTSTCRDEDTQKTLICVYVPTTPVPTSGYFLLVPEEDVTELNWTSEEALQAIVSGGLTAPQMVSYYRPHGNPATRPPCGS